MLVAFEGLLPGTTPADSEWLQRFHAGERRAMAECYRDHFDTVDAVVGRFVSGADRETIIHDVFYQLIARRELRENFQGGSFRAWLTTVTKNQTIDYLRRHRRYRATLEKFARNPDAEPEAIDERAERKQLTEDLKSTIPERWQKLFQVRFVEQLSQREAAERLGIARTTLVYQELRIRGLVARWVRQRQP